MMVSRMNDSYALSTSAKHSSRPSRRSSRQTAPPQRNVTPEESSEAQSEEEYLPDEENDDEHFLPMTSPAPASASVVPPQSPSHAGLMDLFMDSHRDSNARERSCASEVETEGGWSGILEQPQYLTASASRQGQVPHYHAPHLRVNPTSVQHQNHHSQQTPSKQYFSPVASKHGPPPMYKLSPHVHSTPEWNHINPMVAMPPKPWSPPRQDPLAVFQTPGTGTLGRVLLPATSGGMPPIHGYQSSPARSGSGTPTSFSSGGSSYQLSGGYGRRQRQFSMADDEEDDHEDDSSPTKSFHGQTDWRRAPNAPPAASNKSRAVARPAPPAAYPPSSTPMAQSSSQGAERPPEGLPTGPRPTDKPSFSYAAIIGQAILASSKGRLSLAEIYAWISAAFPYYKKGDAGWMNSIRHNLSLNKCFVKVERQKGDSNGKGMLWMIKEGTEHQFDGGGFRKRPLAGGKVEPMDRQRKREKEKRDAKVLTDALATACGKQQQPAASTTPTKRKLDDEPVFGDSGVKMGGGLFKRPTLEKSTTWVATSQKPLAPPPELLRRTSLPPVRPQRACTANVSFVDLASDDASALHDEDDFVTPRKGPESREIPSSVLASAHLPHLTPSVSSPISSPGPQTMPRHGNSHLGRSHLNQVESEIRQAPSSDLDGEGETDEEAVVLQLRDDNHTISPAAVFARVNKSSTGAGLKPGFEFVPPTVRPSSTPRKQLESTTLSPISRVRSDTRPNLPGPNNLLASSPIVSRHRRNISSTGDLASHALNPMRPPQSPVSRSSAAASVSTPYNSSRRHATFATPKSLMGPSFQSSPIRTPAGTYGAFVSQSPFGAALLQHRAEQGRGTNGSESDLLDPFCSALAVQDELQHMAGFQSPTSRPAARWGFEGSPMAPHRPAAVGQSP